MEFSPQELEFRRQVIGASETGGLMGVAKRPNKIELYNWLVNGVRYGEANIWTEAGSYMEPWVAKKFIETYSAPDRPVILEDPREVWADTYGILRHPDYPWIGATLDRFISGTYEPVELKFINNPITVKEYGEEGSEKIPAGYHIQMVQQLAVIRAWCEAQGIKPPELAYHFAYLAGTARAFVIEWEQEPKHLQTIKDVWHGEILQHLIMFREDHWVPQVPPPLDSSEAYARYVMQKRNSAEVTATVRVDNSPEISDLYMKAAAAGQIEKLAKSAKRYYQTALAQEIGQDKGIKTPYGSIQVMGGKQRSDTDWEAVARSFMMTVGADMFNQVVEANTRSFEAKSFVRSFLKKGLQIEEAVTSEVIGFLMNPTAPLQTEESEDE